MGLHGLLQGVLPFFFYLYSYNVYFLKLWVVTPMELAEFSRII
jgi:hypothetical protein